MKSEISGNTAGDEDIFKNIIHILEDMTCDWDMDFDESLGRKTRLIADLEFSSIDIVQFLVAIEEHFHRRGFHFEELVMVDGRYVDEIEVNDVVSFLKRHLNHPS